MIKTDVLSVSGTAMPKPSLAITIRTFDFNNAVKARLESCFSLIYINTTGRRLTEAELLTAVRGAEAVIAGTEPFSANILKNAQKLRLISRVGVGTDSIDLKKAEEKGIRIQITARSTVQPVAEHTIALIFCLAKRIAEYNVSVRANDHSVKTSSLVHGKTVGIVGLGRIGSRVGEIMSCLGCPVVFYDPFVSLPPDPAWIKAGSLEELLAKADIITLHIPAQKDKAPLITREGFNHCRKGALFVNTARGSLVDEQALFDALRSGIIAGAGLDVAAEEPYTGPLLKLPQVVLTPHVASNTRESRIAMENEAVENLIQTITKGSS